MKLQQKQVLASFRQRDGNHSRSCGSSSSSSSHDDVPLSAWKPKAAPKKCKKASSKITDWRDLNQLQLRALCRGRNISYHCHRKESLLKHIEASVVDDPVTEEQLRCAIATAADKAVAAKANKANKAVAAKANKAVAAMANNDPMQELKRMLPQNVSLNALRQLKEKYRREVCSQPLD